MNKIEKGLLWLMICLSMSITIETIGRMIDPNSGSFASFLVSVFTFLVVGFAFTFYEE